MLKWGMDEVDKVMLGKALSDLCNQRLPSSSPLPGEIIRFDALMLAI
jgi:hypothetical protein